MPWILALWLIVLRIRVGDTELSQSLSGVLSSLLGRTGKLMISIQWNENHDWERTMIGREEMFWSTEEENYLGKILNIKTE